MQTLARIAIRRRWLVLASWLVLIVALQALLGGLGGSQYKDDFKLPHTETETVAHLLTASGLSSANGASGTMVIHAKSGTVADYAATVQPALNRLCAKNLGIASIGSPYGPISCVPAGGGSGGPGSRDSAALISSDRTIALVDINWSAVQPTI